MDPLQFCYWLQGFNELNTSGKPPGELQWKIIQDHLQTVFNKVTPTYPGLGPDWQKEILKDINKNPPVNYPPVWYSQNTIPMTGPYTVTCEHKANTQIMSIC